MGGQAVGGGAGEALAGRQGVVQGREAATGVQERRGLHRKAPEQRASSRGGGKSTVRKGGKSLKSFSLKSVGDHNKNKNGRDLNMLLFELNLFLFAPCFPQNTNKPLRLIRVEEERGANVQSLQEYIKFKEL